MNSLDNLIINQYKTPNKKKQMNNTTAHKKKL